MAKKKASKSKVTKPVPIQTDLPMDAEFPTASPAAVFVGYTAKPIARTWDIMSPPQPPKKPVSPLRSLALNP